MPAFGNARECGHVIDIVRGGANEDHHRPVARRIAPIVGENDVAQQFRIAVAAVAIHAEESAAAHVEVRLHVLVEAAPRQTGAGVVRAKRLRSKVTVADEEHAVEARRHLVAVILSSTD